jgi:alkanesulfonate monooxygenase SsuD/methylene tetrahydromethanopterin reductase-like flavin-dependent oxidoreductase (luciferase family)
MGQQKFQFGLVVRGQYPATDDMAARFKETIAMARRADELGFDSITKTSHYSSHPFQMLQQVPLMARFTAEVPNMRLNAGIVLLALASPLDVAENFAAIDVMSGGKLIFGAALGYRDVEFKAFGAQMKDRVRRFEENLVAVKRLWTEEKVSMKGGHFELDEASCLPKPLQKPHPPIWIGANADPAIERAARLGDAWYINPHQQVETIKRQMDLYKRALDKAGKPFPVELPMRRELFVAKNRREAMRLCAPYLGAKYAAYASWGQEKAMPDGDNSLSQVFDELAGDRFIIGSPDEVAEQVLAIHRETGVNHLVMGIEWAGMPQSLVFDTMQLLAEEVMPKVRQAL